MKQCELCDQAARMYCDSDQASLCWDCDAKVHGANFLVAKHSRSLLCRTCQAPTPWRAEGARLGPTVSVCDSCSQSQTSGPAAGSTDGVHEEKIGDEDDDEIEKIGDEDDDEIEDEEEEEEEEEEDEEEEEEGENQVVPWSTTPPPPVASSSSSSDDEGSARRGGSDGVLKRSASQLSGGGGGGSDSFRQIKRLGFMRPGLAWFDSENTLGSGRFDGRVERDQ